VDEGLRVRLTPIIIIIIITEDIYIAQEFESLSATKKWCRRCAEAVT